MRKYFVDSAVESNSLVGRLAHVVASSSEDVRCEACCSAVMSFFGSSSGFTAEGVPDGLIGFRTSEGLDVRFELSRGGSGVVILIHGVLPDTGNVCVEAFDLINDFNRWLPYVRAR